ncbi:MAG: SUMF1/EgtB/PvdO family nonheme iron enzyme [Verrucomicrobiales bacterium]|nr:SUMF1/EgtB/PvdO family nonheme iron enzyme [Verrucomicrobiales bacterium]
MRTSPVGQFAPNRLGIFDLGGNLYEWCLEFYDPNRQTKRVMRGASWRNDPEKILRSSDRIGDPAGSRYTNGGFRCVVENG